MVSPYYRETSLCFDPFDDTQSVAVRTTATPGTPPASYNATPSRTTRSRNRQSSAGHEQTQLEPGSLGFLPLAEWDEYNTYDEETPTRLRYSVEWKVAVNNKVVSKDTEQDVVLAPTAHWHMCLKAKVEKLVSKKLPHSRYMQYDDTSVVVSVNDRSERDLTKRFDGMDIDWAVVERQLVRWGELFRSGKKLRVDLSFNYAEILPDTSMANRGNKRGSSATQRMLVDRASQLDAEQETSGSPSVWREVYALMRCPGPPCNLGPHCWRDSFGKKHYKLRTHHLKTLIEFVQQGHALKGHDDVPEDIREQLYAEEQQRRERQAQVTSAPTPSLPPITITNVLPSQTHESPLVNSTNASTAVKGRSPTDLCTDIPGARDAAVVAYSEWQQSKVIDEELKMEYRKARDATLQDGLDLQQVYEDQDPDFFMKSGVKRGVARRFVSDIGAWAKRYKQSYGGEATD